MCSSILLSSGSFTHGKHEIEVHSNSAGSFDLTITLSVNDEYLCRSNTVSRLSAKEVAMAVELLQRMFNGCCL